MIIIKYYSEDLKKFYDSESDLLKAEDEAKKQKDIAENSRKEMARKIDEANDRIDRAYQSYDAAKKQVNDIINEAKKQVKDILDPAKKEISDAENARMEAIKEFNEKYGVYTETFSGDKAVEQYNRVLNHFNSTFENFWKPFYNWLF